MAKPTIYTIAREAGVSTTTVSKILNNQGHISKETAQRVLEIIRKHNYVPQQRKQHGNAIGVVTFLGGKRPLASPFTAALFNGICQEAFQRERDVTLLEGERIGKLSTEELHCFYTANSLWGLLGVNLPEEHPFSQRVQEARLPFIQLANAAGEGCSITTRNYESVADMIDYILCMGHRRVAFIGLISSRIETHARRLRAYEDTLNHYGIPIRPEFVLDLPDADRTTVKNALARLMARPEAPTALFFASEELSGVIPALNQLGFRIPDDISVAGMTIEKPENAILPELSCIIQPVEELGRRGVRNLMDILGGKEVHSESLENRLYYGDTIRKI